MSMTRSILVTRPEHDLIVKYLCVWSEEVVSLAKSKGMKVYDLKGKKAKKSEFESYTRVNRPELFFMNGHGNANVITGHENEPIVDDSTHLKDGVVYARSCDAGRSLGRYLIDNGARAFIGYRRKFIFGHVPEKNDKTIQRSHRSPFSRAIKFDTIDFD